MTGGAGDLRAGVQLSLVSAVTGWLALWSWAGFSSNSVTYLAPLAVAAVLTGTVGAAARRAGAPWPLVLPAQAMVVGGYVSLMVVGSPVPVGDDWRELVSSWRSAVEAAQAYRAPVPYREGGLEAVLLPLGAACLLVVDALACGLRRVPVAGLALMTIYAVGVSVLSGDVSWVKFALAGGGFLVMLFLQEDDHLARWGRGVGAGGDGPDASTFGVRTGAVRATALGIGGAAMATAVVTPLVIPNLQLGFFGDGLGPGPGDITVRNPIVDLRRDLNRGSDIGLVRVETDDPRPEYLRIAVLTRFNGEEWTPGNREIPGEQSADGVLPPLTGVSGSVERREYAYDVQVLPGFSSDWLPAMATSTFLDAEGNWRYDLDTMDFHAGDDGTDAEGAAYAMRAVTLDLEAAALAAAPAPVGGVLGKYAELPASVPDEVRDLAVELTADAASRYERAVLLQDWFRREGGFRYSLDAPTGNGSAELTDFLEERIGYCEQFSSAFAVMARALRIPARVSVGFLRPDPVGPASTDGPRTYEYSAWDLHAWPELYFPGSGWVRFEPTPGARDNAVAPPYTRQEVPDPNASPSPSTSRTATDDPRDRSSAPVDPLREDAQTGGDGGASSLLLTVVGSAAAIAMTALLALLPGWWRQWRRRRRWEAGPAPEAAWLELRDSAVDLGRPWPHGLSPRATAVRVSHWFGDPDDRRPSERPAHGADYAPAAVTALGRLVRAVERSRYARGYDDTAGDSLREDAELVVRALTAGAARRARQRARWLPASVLARSRRPRGFERVEATGQDSLVDHVG